ncbi:MAG: hypothetical protein KJ808_00370 [Acidobacteria bacterium]|nr:hypothetical protein [Acidobacteriota bacterium]MCG2810486.1 hypothetical protein [Candidatus Aminicenantes bacterium]
MNKRKVILLFLPFILANIGMFGQEQVHERIEVINQEILVRVFSGGKPVAGLNAGDFTLFEDGKKIKINYCRQLRRSLAAKEVPATAPQTAASRKRLFLFMLWFNEESRDWPKAWNYFLTHIYRSGDRVILSDGERVLEVSSPEKELEKVVAFFEGVTVGLKRKKLDKARLVNELERSTAEFYEDLIFIPTYSYEQRKALEKTLLERFKTNYLGGLNEYRLERLKGYPRWLERLAAALKAVEVEKWVLVFLQNERLPLLSRDGRLFREAPMLQETISELKRFMEETERQIQLGTDVISYFRDLQPLFIGANATYHLFLSDAAGETLSGEHLQWKSVFSNWEGAFRQISADTGGRVSDTTKLGDALEKAAESEDIYYVLTYLPAEGKDRKRDLKVEVNKPGMKAVYSRKLTLGEIFPLKILSLDWQDNVLKISLSDYQRLYGEAGLAGRLRVGVQAATKGMKALVFEKEILPMEAAVTVEMALNFPAPGRYLLQVEVEDLLSKNRARAEKEIEILPPPPVDKPQEAIVEETAPSAELAALLELAAGYCRRLKEGAFRFYCLEKVVEKVLQRNPLKQQVETVERRWAYDYQIVGAGGEIKEQRRLLKNAGLKVGAQSVALETRFSSRYSVFLPATLLAAENRGKYRYRLVEREKLKKRRCAVVEVLPRHPQSGEIAQGKVWIDEADGSVLKIEMNPRGVVGVEALEKAAKTMAARLLLEVTHLYLVASDGIRFPSSTTFREVYFFEKTTTTNSQNSPSSLRLPGL